MKVCVCDNPVTIRRIDWRANIGPWRTGQLVGDADAMQPAGRVERNEG